MHPLRIVLTVAALLVTACSTPDIKPINLKSPADKADAEHGKFLANHVAGCIGCHSTRDFSKMAGPIVDGNLGAGGLDLATVYGFPNGTVMVPPNLTPANVSSWSDAELARAIASGLSKDGHALFPAMPYDAYNTMAEDDLRDIMAYLRTLTPVDRKTPERKLTFPLNLVVKKLPREPHLLAQPVKPGDAQYGAYLANMAGCMWCHTSVDDKGRLKKGAEFGGGHAFPVPAPGGGTVFSANLTPDETGLGGWTREAFIARFHAMTVETVSGINVAPGTYNSVMDWTGYAGMTDEDLGAIFDHLRTQKPVKNAVTKYAVGR